MERGDAWPWQESTHPDLDSPIDYHPRMIVQELMGYWHRLSTGQVASGFVVGALAWFVLRYVIFGFFTVDQNERAVITSFGRAERSLGATTVYTPEGASLRPEERERYAYPQLRVIGPGGPYFRWPWQRVHKVSISTRTVNMAWDPENPSANRGNTMLDAVTKDQLNVALTGEIRFRVSEANLYAHLFAVKRPEAHVMGYFISILRERIANFTAPDRPALPALAPALPPPPVIEPEADATSLALVKTPEIVQAELAAIGAVSINDLRKNLRLINEHMDRECAGSIARYGFELDAALITEIDPPSEVESALAAINTAHNQVSSDISLAQAHADQRIVQSRRAVEIETLKAHAETEPLRAMATQLAQLKAHGPGALATYARNVRLGLFSKTDRVYLTVKPGAES